MNKPEFNQPWTEERALSFPHETDFVDYKASAKLLGDFKHDLSCLVSAYANTAGGFIIFGVTDPVPGRPNKSDGGVPVTHKNGTREWLKDVVKGIVKPALTRFNVYEVLSSTTAPSQILAGHAIYVLEIPAASGHGRQALDGKYYAKAGSKTRVLDHYEILALNARGSEGSAAADIHIQPHQTINSTLIVTFRNTGPTVIRDLRLELLLPPEIVQIGCFFCQESQFLMQDGFPWVKFVVPSLGQPLFPDHIEVRCWHLDFRTGLTVKAPNGKFQLPPRDYGYSTLWVGNNPPTRQTIDLKTIITARLWFQPEREDS